MSCRAVASVCIIVIAAGLSCGQAERPERTTEAVPPQDTIFVGLPGGLFVTSLGDSVLIEPFEMSRFEVTNRLYAGLASQAGLELPPDPQFGDIPDYIYEFGEYPVVSVSPDEALSAAAVIGCRLPTLPEWEYAASYGLTISSARGLDVYPWGVLDPVDAQNPANHLYGDTWEDRAADGYPWTAPVGSYPLTDLGLADIAGNVAEMAMIPDDTIGFAVCGGAYASPSEELLISRHGYLERNDRARHIGFRLVRSR
ncbi:SUMF1/EgtB/PvdO family nonheme iron enzyme [Candidatus Fermentibacterales bacterium]|nr:SUMF1/EgtB/PvdO family nonheme iron enzyme [Candidatus Fermentibacterales bacterium]